MSVQIVNINVRPLKQLLVLTDSTKEWMKYAIEYACESLGGKWFAFLLLDNITNFNKIVLERLDPDIVIVLGEDGKNKFNAEDFNIKPFKIEYQNKISFTTFYGGFNNPLLYENWESQQIKLFNIEKTPLHLLARYGIYSSAISMLNIKINNDLNHSIDSELKNWLFSPHKFIDNPDFSQFNTPVGIFDIKFRCSLDFDYENLVTPVLILVTGYEDNLEDLCVFWHLRAFSISSKVLWAPIEEIQTNIDQLIDILVLRAGSYWNNHTPLVALVSESLSDEELNTIYQELFSNVSKKLKDNSPYLTNNRLIQIIDPKTLIPRYFNLTSFTSSHLVQNNVLTYSLPSIFEKIQASSELYRKNARFALEITNTRYLYPSEYTSDESRIRYSNGSLIISYELGSQLLIPDMGYTKDLKAGHTILIPYYLPSSIQLIKNLFATKEVEYNTDDKLKYALGLFELFDNNLNNLEILSNNLIYRWLLKLIPKARDRLRNDIHNLISDIQDDNKEQIYEYLVKEGLYELKAPVRDFKELKNLFKNIVGRYDSDNLIGYLINHQILFRGFTFTCSHCSYKSWYDLGSISQSKYKCRGCLQIQFIPSPQQGTDLSLTYSPNEIFTRCLDQGALLHLLAIFLLEKNLGFISWWVPGGTLENEEWKSDVDFIAIISGEIIIGECKESTTQMTDEIVKNLVDKADRINCKKVGLCTLEKIEELSLKKWKEQYSHINFVNLFLEIQNE